MGWRGQVGSCDMATHDTSCSIVPYFEVAEGKMGEFRNLCERFVERTRNEPGCLYYGFSFDGMTVHCREAYRDAGGVLAHLENVGPLLEEALKISRLMRLEIHGPETELARLRGPLSGLEVRYYVLEYGFRN
jgi:quinol monooxygenase YgiN